MLFTLSTKYLSLLVLLCQNAFCPIIARLATTETNGDERYDVPTSVVMGEVLKAVISLLLIFGEDGSFDAVQTEIVQKPRDTLKLAVPAVLYLIQNQLLQFASSNLPAAVFQVMYQGKTLVVALFSILLLSKELSRVKWLALTLMGLGLAVVQLADAKEGQQSSMANADEQHTAIGLMFTLAGCFCSGFAGVYFEKMMKGPTQQAGATPPTPPSMWVRNLQLAIFSILLGGTQIIFSRVRGGVTTPMLHGFTSTVWGMVINSAIGGICVACVIKYADNLLKGFACALATVFTAVLSVPIFGLDIGPTFVLGSVIVVGSTLLYGGTVKLPGAWWTTEPELCTKYRGRGDNKPGLVPL